MSVRFANTRLRHQTQMLSPFVDSSVDNVPLQINPDFNQLLLEFIDIPKQRLLFFVASPEE